MCPTGSRAVAIVAAFAGLASQAGAAVLCAKPRGDGTFSTTVKIREACRPVEMQLDPAGLGIPGPPGPEGPEGPAGPGLIPGLALKVADSTGATVGAPLCDPAGNCGNLILSTPVGPRTGPVERVFGFPPRPICSRYSKVAMTGTADDGGGASG